MLPINPDKKRKPKDPRGDLGKWAEKQTHTWLEEMSKRTLRFKYHRLPDARAARGALAAQPSDFIVGLRGIASWLEVKETEQVRRLPKAKISQYGQLYSWYLANFQVFVLVYRSKLDDWVILNGYQLFEGDAVSLTSFSMDDQPSYPTAAAALAALYE